MEGQDRGGNMEKDKYHSKLSLKKKVIWKLTAVEVS